jgi:multidrug efflux system outer membrane protein
MKFRSFHFLLLIIFLLQGLSSCTPFAPAARVADEEVSVSESFSIKDTVVNPDQRWWEAFDNKELNSYVDVALTGNQTLASYWARLEKSQAQARKAGADLKPSLAGDSGVSHTRIHTTDMGTVENENYSVGLVAGYEVDLWGRIRATHSSALLDAEASREDFNAAAITIAAEVTERWVSILSQKLQKELLEQQLSSNEIYLDLVELRFRKSLASALDVLQQRQLVEKTKAQLPLIEMQEGLFKNQLAVLLGRMPNELPENTHQELPVLDTPPAAGLPVQLLQNRPDIVGAVKRLEATDQDLAAARADRLPSLRLTGSGHYNSDELNQIFDNWIVNLAAALTAPIIDGGRRKAEVDIKQAEVQLQLAEYRQLVLSAVREVEDALIRETKIREHIGAVKNQLGAARNALKEAGTRYLNGLNDYLPVLTQILAVQGLESDLIQRQADLLVARVSLYRAIGGSWADELSLQSKLIK